MPSPGSRGRGLCLALRLGAGPTRACLLRSRAARRAEAQQRRHARAALVVVRGAVRVRVGLAVRAVLVRAEHDAHVAHAGAAAAHLVAAEVALGRHAAALLVRRLVDAHELHVREQQARDPELVEAGEDRRHQEVGRPRERAVRARPDRAEVEPGPGRRVPGHVVGRAGALVASIGTATSGGGRSRARRRRGSRRSTGSSPRRPRC